MVKPRSLLARIILYTGISILTLFIALILWIVTAFNLSGRHNKQSIEAAVSAIQLPARYKLISSVYQDARCVDVCAHTVLTYQSMDGNALEDGPVIEEIKHLGYRYEGGQYTKIYRDKPVHITEEISIYHRLIVDVSL